MEIRKWRKEEGGVAGGIAPLASSSFLHNGITLSRLFAERGKGKKKCYGCMQHTPNAEAFVVAMVRGEEDSPISSKTDAYPHNMSRYKSVFRQ